MHCPVPIQRQHSSNGGVARMGREGFRKRPLPCLPSHSQLQQGMAEIHKNSLGSLRGVVKEAEESAELLEGR